MKTLMPHQQEALDYTADHPRPAFFMEMRLGKTLTAIRWAKGLDVRRILILGPKSVLPPWIAELKEEIDPFEGTIMLPEGSTAKKLKDVSAALKTNVSTTWVLLNYEAIVRCPALASLNWDVVICDESTRIRNPQAIITNRCYNFSAPYKAILTGLPNPESLMDYFSQFKFLDGHFMGYDNFWKFRNALFTSWDGYSWMPKIGTTEKIKTYVQNRAFVRTRKQVGLGSRKVYSSRYVDMNVEQKRLYKEAEKEFLMTFKEKTLETKWATVKSEWCQQICGGVVNVSDRIKTKDAYGRDVWKITKRIWKTISSSKLNEIVELLKTDLKGEKVVIWFKHNAELEFVSKELRMRGYHVGIFTSEEKFGINDGGTLSDRTDIMCAQPKCGLYGLDWSKASTAIYYSNWYDSEIRHQTEDRIIHPRKQEPVLYIDLLTKDSIDEDVKNALSEKKLGCRYTMVDLFNKMKERKRS